MSRIPSRVLMTAVLIELVSLAATSAKAVYAYTATSVDELSFEEGEALAIVDSSEADWWRAEKGGVIGVVPASYFDLQS